jgi:hypothetical protein
MSPLGGRTCEDIHDRDEPYPGASRSAAGVAQSLDQHRLEVRTEFAPEARRQEEEKEAVSQGRFR